MHWLLNALITIVIMDDATHALLWYIDYHIDATTPTIHVS